MIRRFLKRNSGSSAIDVRPLEHAVVGAADRDQKGVIKCESDVQNFAGVSGISLAFAALRNARIAIQLYLNQEDVTFASRRRKKTEPYQTAVISNGDDVPTVASADSMHWCAAGNFWHQSCHSPAMSAGPRVPRRAAKQVKILHDLK